MLPGPARGNRPAQQASAPLPEAIAKTLAPTTRHALMHPTRRGILRELNRHLTSPQTPQDLLPLFPGTTTQTITYHALVLTQCGGASLVDATPSNGTVPRSFVSTVAEDREYTEALAATEHLDAGSRG